MRKLLLTFISFAAVVAAAVSCANEIDPEGAILGAGEEVTFKVFAPEDVVTKAISDGTGATDLKVAVYDEAGTYLANLTAAMQVTGNSPWSVTVPVVKDLTYQFVFFAHNTADNGFYTLDASAKTLTVDYTKLAANNDAADAFYAHVKFKVENTFTKEITLRRPLAQLNIGASDLTAASYSIDVDSIKIGVNLTGIYKTMNLLDSTVTNQVNVNYEEDLRVTEATQFVEGFDRIGMVYALVDQAVTSNVDIKIAATSAGSGTALDTIKRSVSNVPLKRNYRTNILGTLFTNIFTFTVTTDPGFIGVDDYSIDFYPTYNSIAELNEAFANMKAIGYKVAVALEPTAAVSGAQTITLPKTSDEISIFFRGNFTEADITIAYAENAEAYEKPSKLIIEAPLVGSNTKSINKLIGDLTATTVVLAGTTTVDTADFHTASNTLLIEKDAKIINKLTVYAGSLVVEGFIETAVIDPAVAVNTVDGVATVKEDGEVVRFIVQNLKTVIESGAKVGSLEVSTTDDFTGTAPTVTVEESAVVGTLNIDNGTGTPVGDVVVNTESQVDVISGDTDTVKDQNGNDVCFVYNLTELQEAIAANKTPIYYKGDAITEKFTLTPANATVISGLKVSNTNNLEAGPVVTINGPITLNGAEIKTKAYCAMAISANVTTNLNDCEIETLGYNGNAAGSNNPSGSNARAININGGTTVKMNGCKVNVADLGGYSRGLNLLDEGAHVTVENCVIGVAEYAINYPNAVNTVVVVKDSKVKGWCITNMWNAGNDITFENCELYSLNDKGYNAEGWNDFSAFKFDGTVADQNCKITVKDCAVDVSSTTGNKQSLIGFMNNGNVLKFQGSSMSLTTSGRFEFAYQPGLLFDGINNLYVDETSKNLLTPYFDDNIVVSGPEGDMYTVSYVPEIFYSWIQDNVRTGSYCSLADPFNKGWLSNDEYIDLKRDITLTANINCQISSVLTEDGKFYFALGDYSITKGDYSIALPDGISVLTDKQTDVFSAAAGEGYVIKETEISGDVYKYKYEVTVL